MTRSMFSTNPITGKEYYHGHYEWMDERPDKPEKEPEKNDIFKTEAGGEPDHDLIYWLQNT